MNLNYFKRLFFLIKRDPLKLRSLLRFKFSKIDFPKDKKSLQNIKPPLVVSIRPTQGCNLRCVMCPQWGDNGVFTKKPELSKREVTTEEIKKFIDDIAIFNPYIYFSGGEPLINQDIFDLISYASSKHLVTSMNTNGTYLYENAEKLIKSGLDYLYTSLDAPSGLTNDSIRKSLNSDNSFSGVIKGIKHIAKLRDEVGTGLPIIEVKTVIVNENQNYLFDMAKFVQDELNVDIWAIGLSVFTTDKLNSETSNIFEREFQQDQVHWSGFIREFPGMDYENINEQLENVKSAKWKFKLKIGKPMDMNEFSLKKYHESPEVFATSEDLKCMNPYVFAQMQPSGEIAFCGSQPDYTIGNIKDSKFLDLWNSEKAFKWRKFLQDNLFPSCKRCWSLHEYQQFKA